MSEENPILDELGLDTETQGQGENPEKKSDTQVDKLDPEIQRRDAQIAHWRQKAEKAEELLKTQKPKAGVDENVEIWKASNDPLEVVKLGKALQNYDEQETEFIIRNAPSRNIEGILKAEKDEMVQLAIRSRREKVQKENKVPSPSSSGSGGFTEKSPEEVAKMDRDAHKALWKEQQERAKSEGI